MDAIIYTFSGWPEAFPCHISQAREVVEILLGEIIPRFGILEGFSSDKRPHFTTEVARTGLSKLLQFKWYLHTPWSPQSSGKGKWMNQTIRRNCKTVSRNPHEGGRCITYCFNKNLNHPMSQAELSPFEILNDRLCPIDTVVMEGDQMHMKCVEKLSVISLLGFVLSE